MGAIKVKRKNRRPRVCVCEPPVEACQAGHFFVNGNDLENTVRVADFSDTDPQVVDGVIVYINGVVATILSASILAAQLTIVIVETLMSGDVIVVYTPLVDSNQPLASPWCPAFTTGLVA